MPDPRLTVIMPAHNAETTMAAAIQSILCQSYSDFELWVLESNSKDRTAEVARSFSDPRVKVFELGKLSFQDTLIYALENAKSEWLARMDADDMSFPDRFKEQIEIIEQQPDVVLVGTRCVYLTPFGHIFETRPKAVSKEVGPLSLRLVGESAKFFPDASVIFKRSVAIDAGGYDLEFRMGDLPLWFRLLRRGRGWEIANPLYLRRLDPGSMMNSKIKASDEGYRITAKYTPELLHLHYPESSTRFPKSPTWHMQSYWLNIAAYESLTGDYRTIHKAVDFLEQGDCFKKEARLIRWFTYLGRVGTIYYRWHRRNKYLHRPDLEKFFTELFGPLALSDKFILTGNHT